MVIFNRIDNFFFSSVLGCGVVATSIEWRCGGGRKEILLKVCWSVHVLEHQPPTRTFDSNYHRMSAPSFSSFPDLEGGSNSQSVSVAKHEGRKKHKKSTKGKHKDGNAQDRHEGRSDSYQHRSQTVETSDSVEGNTQGSLKSFFSDHKGDALNIRFGSLNSSDIPRYRPIGGE